MMKNKKSVIISCIVGILLLAICGGVLFSMPVIKYNNGNNAIKNSNYELAIEIFTGLDGYKDSYQKIKEARYCLAKDKLESDDIVSGIHMLQNLGEYKDSKQLIVEYTPLLNIIKMKNAQKGEVTPKV